MNHSLDIMDSFYADTNQVNSNSSRRPCLNSPSINNLWQIIPNETISCEVPDSEIGHTAYMT